MRSRCMHVSKDCRVGCPGRTIISGGREGADVGEAREVMDRVTDAIQRGDLEALKGLYAQDAVAETPDHGTITGRDHIAAYLAEFGTAFPDAAWEERVRARGRRHGNRRRNLRWDEYRLHYGAERRNHSRDRQECAHSRVRRRDGREWGCHEPPFLLRRAGLGHAARSRARVPRVALGGAVGVLGASAGLARKPGNREKEGKR